MGGVLPLGLWLKLPLTSFRSHLFVASPLKERRDGLPCVEQLFRGWIFEGGVQNRPVINVMTSQGRDSVERLNGLGQQRLVRTVDLDERRGRHHRCRGLRHK
jgi:hypothetical protein